MALISKFSKMIGSTIGRKYSTTVDAVIPMDRVFENSKTGTKFVLTSDYSVARNGINNRKEFVIYYPEKFKCSFHKRYDDFKSSGIELITKFNFAKPGTKLFRSLVNARIDAMSALTLFTDAPNTDNVEFLRAYHDNLMLAIISDDLLVETLPHKFAKFQQQIVENVKLAYRVNEPKLLDKNDSQLSSEETHIIDEANRIILAYKDMGARLRRHCSANVYNNYCDSLDIFYDYIEIENSLVRQNRPITWNEFINIGPYQTAVHSVLALNFHTEPLMSAFDPFITLGILYTRLWNDVVSYDREMITQEKARNNSVTVLRNMYPNKSIEQSMAEVMRMATKILNDVEEHVEYLRDEEKQVYIKLFKQFIGFSESQVLSKKFNWNRISGTPSIYETFEYNGVIYGKDE